jgi:modulator of drug activity B
MEPKATFACHDVMKNPEIEHDFARFDVHLNKYFAGLIQHEQAI